ncbi:MAG: CpaF family protein, partial [Lentisphaerae bacterium]|nr:CpaF family protein [Lentisphaerota bacterium]
MEDLNSGTGTLIDGKRVTGRASFRTGQEVRIGSWTLKLNWTGLEQEPESVTPEKPIELYKPEVHAATRAPVRDPHADEKREIKRQIHSELLDRLDITRLTAANIGEKDLHDRASSMLTLIINDISKRLPSWLDQRELKKEIYDEAVGLGPLEDLLADPEITEIMVNRFDQIYIERHGKLTLSDSTFMDNSSVLAIIERIVAPIGRRIDESQPYVDARLRDGSRVNAIIPPLALTGPCLTIRKFSDKPFTVNDLIRFNTLTRETTEFLDLAVKLRKNIVVAGGTGSGKTTFLNVMSSFIPGSDRIVTIEDSAELKLTQDHIVRLESRPPNIEGKGAITIRDLLRNALRMRPDRIVIGECRGGESLDMLQAMNTGHD